MAAGTVLAIVALIVVVLVLLLVAAMRLVPATLGVESEENTEPSDDGSQSDS
jgi:hypothetical protein